MTLLRQDRAGRAGDSVRERAQAAGRVVAELAGVRKHYGEVHALRGVDIQVRSGEALAGVRSAVTGFRARGIQGEVANAKLALEAGGVAFDYYLEPMELPPERESVLALALREAVTNVLRHAHAGRCRVRLQRIGEHAQLTVDDDGVGGADAAGGVGDLPTS